jgi:long-subunit acyl-CoA synthetase (AMP-forming)
MTQAAIATPSATERDALMGAARERTLVELFRRQAELHAEDPAPAASHGRRLADEDVAAVRDRGHLAAWYQGERLETGGHVAIWSFNRPAFVIASTATLLVRACTVPLYQTSTALGLLTQVQRQSLLGRRALGPLRDPC